MAIIHLIKKSVNFYVWKKINVTDKTIYDIRLLNNIEIEK